MAQRKKRKLRKSKVAKRKVAARTARAGQRNAAKRAAVKSKAKKRAQKPKTARPTKRKAARAARKPVKLPQPPVERVIVDTIEEPVPGVVVVTEYEAVVQRGTPGDEDETA